jgi:hypothetical protein
MSRVTLPDSTPRVEVSQPLVGLVHMQLCAVADATDAEILEVANRDNPSGTSHGWTEVLRDPAVEGAPTPCTWYEGRVHFLVVC